MLGLISPGHYIASLEGGGRKAVTTAGTRVRITTTETPIEGVLIQAEESNSGNIVVGGSDVVAAEATRVGFALDALQSIFLPIKDLSIVYLDSTANGDAVSYLPYR